MRVGLAVWGLILLLAGCAARNEPATTKTLTERQRDSLIGRSVLPGAAVVQRSMSVSDVEARRAAAMNAAVDSMPH